MTSWLLIRQHATGYATLAAAIFGLVAVIVAAFMDNQSAALQVR
jgi:hypothetical protein